MQYAFKISYKSALYCLSYQLYSNTHFLFSVSILKASVVIFTPEFTTNAMTFDFPWLSGDVPRLPPYGIYISQLVRFARCCTSVLISSLKIFKSLQNY